MARLLHCCGPVVRQNIMAARVYSEAKLLTSWQPGSRESDRKGLGTRYVFPGHAPMACFPYLPVLQLPNSLSEF
jgi:hypothetical protein